MSRPQTINKQNTRQDLIHQGRELFSQHGLKGTSIRDLTLAVGIAQGSFYLFFEAKEMLFFEILEREENAIAERMVQQLQAHPLTRAHLQTVVNWAIEELRGNPILHTVLDPIQYARLLRKIPAERLQSHMQNERELLTKVVADLQSNGLIAPIEPEELMGLFHALFVTTLHEEEIGVEIFHRVLNRLVCLIADHVATQGERTTQP